MILAAPASEPRLASSASGVAKPLEPRVEITLHNPGVAATDVPITVGVPLPRGTTRDDDALLLRDPLGRPVPLQRQTLARWSDGSIQWVLVDFLAETAPNGSSVWSLERVNRAADFGRPRGAAFGAGSTLTNTVCAAIDDTFVPEHAATDASHSPPISVRLSIHNDRFDLTTADGAPLVQLAFPLMTDDGRVVVPAVEATSWLATGPVRSTLAVDGAFPGTSLQFHTRLSVYPETGLVRLETRLRNPERAVHRGGLWDLGDPNSVHFRSFGVEITPSARRQSSEEAAAARALVAYSKSPSAPATSTTRGVEIIQHGSAGPNWDAPTHVDRSGRVALKKAGAEVITEGGACDEPTLRAEPLVSLSTAELTCGLALPEFWQQFPKSVRADGQGLFAGLFPDFGDTLHELQPGEQKTHTVWLRLSEPSADRALLNWVRQPIRAALSPQWHAAAKCPTFATPVANDPDTRLVDFLRGALTGERSLDARRDQIDEYGWRNFGDLHADHEQLHYKGTETVVSHYNNQFDAVFGGILQLARTGDPAWYGLFDPLARHVIDIDLYHTDRDRAAYNGGLFWHTDHYRAAGRCTHRTYSQHNQPVGKPYGGGPSCEHNYTTGLLHYYWMTGNPDARDAVLSLANWVLAMDDGRKSVFGLVDAGPTGLATATTEPDYHGPGRGAGNSLNALTDAWLLTRNVQWLEAAAAIIRRVVHPQQDLDALNLLHAELRWSYTVFLAALAKWLDVKAEAGQIDDDYAYGQASLLHYARWMERHERPYFDHFDQLEYPTSTWPAQELRKANVFRLAARHADEPERTRLLARGDEFSRRAWSDLPRFDNPFVARVLSILMTEGAREAWLASHPPAVPRGTPPTEWVPFTPFVSQKTRVKRALKSLPGLLRLATQALNPLRWLQAGKMLGRQR